MLKIFLLFLVTVIACLASVNTSFAQSTETNFIIGEELVHRVINGTFVIEKRPVEITVTEEIPLTARSTVEDLRPWHIKNGFETKIDQSLQMEIDGKKKICTYELDFDECPSLDKNTDDKPVLNVIILLQDIPLWPNGYPDGESPTKEQRHNRLLEVIDEYEIRNQPFVEFLESNNQTVTGETFNLIYADIDLDFLPNLVSSNDVLFIESSNVILKAQLFESKQITGVEQAKTLTGAGGNVIVAVIDSGLDIVDGSYNPQTNTATPSHRDLNTAHLGMPKLNKIMDLYSPDGDNPDDCNGHGTAIAGIISGSGIANFKYSGYASDSKLNVYKVTRGCSLSFDSNSTANAIKQAMMDGVDVINISFGSPGEIPNIASMIKAAFNAGIAIVGSVGNEGSDVGHPAHMHNVLGVGASFKSDPNTRTSYSNFGKADGRINPDLVAPVNKSPSDDTGLTTTALGSESYQSVSGTSFAAPQVSGAIADLIDRYNMRNMVLDPGQAYAILLSQATGSGTNSDGLRMDNQVGAGALSMRHTTLETTSSKNSFGGSSTIGRDSFTFTVNVHPDAERFTIALWWPILSTVVYPENVDLSMEVELYRGSTLVARSAAEMTSSQRIIIDNPVTGVGAYTLKLVGINAPLGQTLYHSRTSTLTNDVPTMTSRGSNVIANPGTSVNFALTGDDPNLDIVTFFVNRVPTQGTISPESGLSQHLTSTGTKSSKLTYTSDNDASGTDSFEVTPWDGKDLGQPITFNVNFSDMEVPDPPDAIDDFAFTLDGTTIRFTWNHPNDGGSDITYYRIDRSSDGVTWEFHESFSETETSYNYVRPEGFDGYYRIMAYNAAGSSVSNELYVVVPDTTPPIVRISDAPTYYRTSDIPISGNISEPNNSGIMNIQISVNGVASTAPITLDIRHIESNVSFQTTLTDIPNGNHVITVTANNRDNLVGIASITITVDKPVAKTLDSFSDDFETDLLKWLLTSDDDQHWNIEESVMISDSAPDNKVAQSADCDNICTMTMIDSIDITQMEMPKLSFYRFVSELADKRHGEGIVAYISEDGGGTWSILERFTADESDDDNTWHLEEYNLDEYSSTQFSVRFDGISSTDNEVMRLDDVRIYDSAIIDTAPPEIIAPIDITAEATGTLTVISIGNATTTDDVDLNPVITNDAPDSFPVGITTITWTATDASGNLSTATQIIAIQDTVNPTIAAPADVMAEVTCPGTMVDLIHATATDSVDSNPVITHDAPLQFPPGATTITWTATDASGNQSTDTQTVTIQDTTNPVLVPIDNLVSESITVTDYANMAPSVTDNSCDVIIPTHDAPESFPVGTTTVTWTATDSAGNSASTTHTVTIQDVAPPIIMAPLDVISEVTCPGTAVSLGTAAVSDNYDPSPQIRHDAPDSFPLGTTTVIWTATDDSGNMATDEQLVTIRDTTKPVLGSIDNLVSEPITVHDYANMAPSVTDNSCDVIIPTHDAPESFPLGDTIVTWTATDTAGNSASTTHTVTIHTAQLIITAPLDVTAEVTCPGTTVSLGMAAVSDNYDPSPEITNDAPESFPLGTTTVTWTATDSAGTVATDTQQVTVRDTTAPGIRQVNDITQESTATLSPISLTAPGTVDNSCDVPTLTHDAPGSFPVGITIVTWTATDSSGNSAKAIQIITILGDGMSQPLQAYRIISNTLDDSNRSQDHSLVRLGDTFVLAHKNGGQGVIRSFDVSSDGRSITQLDALPHRSGLNEDMIQIGDNTLALVYAGNIDTLRVTDGDITPIKTHGIGSGYGPELVRLGHDTYALAYGYNSKSSDVSILRIPSHGNEVEHLDRVAHASTRTVNHNGVYVDSGIFVMAYSSLGGSNLVTFSVSPPNQISKLADMQYYPKKSFGTSVVAIDEDTVALGYTSLEGAYVKTYNVATNGTLSYVSQAKLIGSLSVDINIVHLSGQTHLAAYSDGGYGGWMRPLLIDNEGSITTGPAVMHDDQALYGSLVRADDDTAVFAYRGANSVSKIAILGVVTPEP